MNRIDQVEINGFWDNRDIGIKFFPDVNFFIGVNGSGKTTVINIIAAALEADFINLDKLPFTKITIKLRDTASNRRPILVVEKSKSDRSPFSSISYKIKNKASDSFEEYSLDDFEEKAFLRGATGQIRRHLSQRDFLRGGRTQGLIQRLKELRNVSWLSIHRSTPRYEKAESFESSVDEKLDELNVRLGRYLSSLSNKIQEEVEQFQKDVIRSLISEHTETAIFTSVQNIDLAKEQNALLDIFRKLNLHSETIENRTKKYFEGITKVSEKFQSQKPLRLNEVLLVADLFRSHRAVQNWNKLTESQESILLPRITFLTVLNKMFERKRIDINEENEIIATTDSGKSLKISHLSSGEKQLLIILGEALLQQSTPWIYIADEPELSLHVSWQEQLIENVRLLNPHAQIICATHSPDVISRFSNNVFSMEKLLK